jgi:hypothetical protein
MNVFSNLQQEVIGRLTATVPDIPTLVPANGQVNWITEDIGDLANIIAKTIGTLGIIGIVMTPGGGKLYSEGKYPISLFCPIIIQIQENVVVNRRDGGTKIPNLDLVQFCLLRLHLWSPSGQRVNKIEVDADVPFILVSEYPILTYNVQFNIGLTVT